MAHIQALREYEQQQLTSRECFETSGGVSGNEMGMYSQVQMQLYAELKLTSVPELYSWPKSPSCLSTPSANLLSIDRLLLG